MVALTGFFTLKSCATNNSAATGLALSLAAVQSHCPLECVQTKGMKYRGRMNYAMA